MTRVIAYIDGFNLYFGLKENRWKRYYWLDLQTLSRNLLTPNEELVFTKYFTTRVAGPPDKRKRQGIFIEALETLSNLQIFYGHYQSNPRECRRCGFVDFVPNEKMTDVNISVEMLADAYQDKFDVALLVSADSDLTAPITAIQRLFPSKRVVIAFPPNRSSKALAHIANHSFQIGRRSLAKSLFRDQVTKADGFVLQRPPSWK